MQPQLPSMDLQFDSENMGNSSVFKQVDHNAREDNEVTFVKENLVVSTNGIRILSNPQLNRIFFEINPNCIEEKQKIGSGQSGIVKRALYKTHHVVMQVAVKEIYINQTKDQKSKRDQFINELKTYLGQVSAFLVECYGCYYEEGFVKLVTQYMDIGSLNNILYHTSKANLVINEFVLAQIASQILQGLQWIHKVKHQIHRDIKPQNILINSQGKIKIADFGITKCISQTYGAVRTFIGTTLYMSPERSAFLDYNYKCDIWSVGLVLWQLATGQKLPYYKAKDNPLKLLNRIISIPAPKLQQGRFTAQLCDFIEQCLEKNPENRSNCSDLLKHPWLQQHLNKIDILKFIQQVKNLP